MSDTINYYYYAFGFIDVLGQKEAFRQLDGLELSDNDPRLIETHKKTVVIIDHLRKWFSDFYTAYTAEEPLAADLNIPIEKMTKFLDMRKSNIKHQIYSDFIQVYASLHDEKYHCHAINGLYGVLSALGSLMVLSLAAKKALRAGVEVGLGTELESGELYGPVVYKAYDLEQNIAKYPRIVIGPKLLDYLDQLSKKVKQFPGQEEDDIKLCKNGADRCRGMIVPDEDGVLILDYLGDKFSEGVTHGQSAAEYQQILGLASEYVKNEAATRYHDVKLGPRYAALAKYFKKNHL